MLAGESVSTESMESYGWNAPSDERGRVEWNGGERKSGEELRRERWEERKEDKRREGRKEERKSSRKKRLKKIGERQE